MSEARLAKPLFLGLLAVATPVAAAEPPDELPSYTRVSGVSGTLSNIGSHTRPPT
jgi:hypothetical protein